MASSARLVKPAQQELLRLTVRRAERLSPHWMRITLADGEIERFRPMGYDQWFRIFLPVSGEEGLERLPAKANRLLGYLRYLRIPDGLRPVMRNYTVRAYRASSADGGPEIDVDFVLHGSASDGTAGPASRWAETCAPGEDVVIIDEGLGFNPERGVRQVLLVADETGQPAIAGVCATLPDDASGLVLIEAPHADDVLEFDRPAGVEVRWLVRDDPHQVPGARALAALREADVTQPGLHAFVVGEQALATGARRLLVGERGLDRNAVSFVGYWRSGSASPAPKAARASGEAS
ncbi:siderophore-interacting protein [Microbacterium marinilacus]|uniref:Siderophore-interacting protein n=1 Tax=Microbacterium marinilacus TaxID=415209 RepID=A0ABP7BFW7_9MICO|nr:siderophore-interacting protein [Microbacterium marinilacus]MBY0690175.1 siderophore-interacting protein [Microbacterium marinilacus]